MNKSRYITLLMAGCMGFSTLCVAVNADSKINDVVVYPTGAMITRTAKVKLNKGKNEVNVNMLTPLLDQKSVHVAVLDNKSGNVVLESVNYDAEVANKNMVTSELKRLSKRNKVLKDSIEILNASNKVLNQEYELVSRSTNIGGEQGFTASTMQGVAGFVRKDLKEITDMRYANKKRIEALTEESVVNKQNINLLNEKQMEPKSLLKLSLNAQAAVVCDLEIQYFVENASWMPYYEARISKLGNSLNLIQKAYVSQASKEGWEKVKLSLSQNDPTLSNEKPELTRYFIPGMMYDNQVAKIGGVEKMTKVLGIVRDENGPLKGVLVKCGEDRKTETDENGYYEMLAPRSKGIEFYYNGYSSVVFYAKGGNVEVKNLQMGRSRSEVFEVKHNNIYNNYARQNKVVLCKTALVSDESDNRQMMSIRNVTHDIVGKNSVPEDGVDHEVVIKNMPVKADYEYYAVPKLSKDVYLVASIPDWKKYDLMDGNVKLFLNNMYMGESFISARQTEDTLRLSIGKDKDLAVERTDMRTYSSKNMVKTSNKIQHDWKITVKNNKNEAVKIKVEDQYPVSVDNDVKVELVEKSGAKVDETEGKLTWNLTLKPGEKKELIFSYIVKSKDYINVE